MLICNLSWSTVALKKSTGCRKHKTSQFGNKQQLSNATTESCTIIMMEWWFHLFWFVSYVKSTFTICNLSQAQEWSWGAIQSPPASVWHWLFRFLPLRWRYGVSQNFLSLSEAAAPQGQRWKEREEHSVSLTRLGNLKTRSCAGGATWTQASSEWPASGSSE